MELRIWDLYTSVDLPIDALLCGLLGSDGFVIPGVIKFLEGY